MTTGTHREVTIVRNMTIGTHRKATTPRNIWKRTETIQGSTKEETTTVTDQGMSRDLDIGKHLETDRGKGDRGKEARAPEDRGREATVLEVVVVVVEEEEEDRGREATVLEVVVVEEEEEDMRRGEVMLAMGAEAEKVAQRP